MQAIASLFGGGGGSKKEVVAPVATAPATAKSTITGAGVAPGTGPDDFKKQQSAYWSQFLSGTGQGGSGGGLPDSVQSNIDKQASLLTQGAPPQVQQG